jgi:hypothetical protein
MTADGLDSMLEMLPVNVSPSYRQWMLLHAGICGRLRPLIESEELHRAVEAVELRVDGEWDGSWPSRDRPLVDGNELQQAVEGGESYAPLSQRKHRLAVVAAELLYRRFENDNSDNASYFSCLQRVAAKAVAWAALGDRTEGLTWQEFVDPASSARQAWGCTYRAECHAQMDLARCILGDPWSPRLKRAWVTPRVARLAHRIYDARRFSDLPLLADALEASRCKDENILGHLRGPGPHGLGCFIVDGCTGRAGPVAGSEVDLAASNIHLHCREMMDNLRDLDSIVTDPDQRLFSGSFALNRLRCVRDRIDEFLREVQGSSGTCPS